MTKDTGSGFGETPEESSIAVIEGITIDDLVIETTTFAEMGEELPVGVCHDGTLLKDYKLAPFTGELEVELERLFKVNKQGADKIIYAAENFLPMAVKQIGGLDIHKIQSDPRQVFSQMYLGDVLILLQAIRCNYQESRDIAISGQCPNCNTINADKGTPAQPYHDLGSVEIKRYRGLTSRPLINVPLPHGFSILGEDIKMIQMEPMKFHQLKYMTENKGDTFDSLKILGSLIRGFPGSKNYQKFGTGLFGADMYGRLISHRKDKIAAFEAVEKLQVGPVMSIDMDCINCNHRWKEGLPWAALTSFLYGPLVPAA